MATKKTFQVLHMGCAACSARIETIINGLEGVESANVNFAAANVSVEFDPKKITPESIQEAVRKGGYDLLIDDDSGEEAVEAEKKNFVN